MCEDDHEEILEEIKSLSDRIRTIEALQVHINERVMSPEFVDGIVAAKKIDNLVVSGQLDLLLKNGVQEMKTTVESLRHLMFGNPHKGEIGLAVIINGNEDLSVEPLRTTLRRVALTHDRLIWLAGILGISTIGGVIGWVLFFLNKGTVP